MTPSLLLTAALTVMPAAQGAARCTAPSRSLGTTLATHDRRHPRHVVACSTATNARWRGNAAPASAFPFFIAFDNSDGVQRGENSRQSSVPTRSRLRRDL